MTGYPHIIYIYMYICITYIHTYIYTYYIYIYYWGIAQLRCPKNLHNAGALESRELRLLDQLPWQRRAEGFSVGALILEQGFGAHYTLFIIRNPLITLGPREGLKGLGVWGLGVRAYGFRGLAVQGFRGLGFRIQGSGVQALETKGFRNEGFRHNVWDSCSATTGREQLEQGVGICCGVTARRNPKDRYY